MFELKRFGKGANNRGYIFLNAFLIFNVTISKLVETPLKIFV